jgi:glycosyltransferase involved in cell wall biosynthesis
MRIGIDISALQGPHRMRGIGYTVLNFINHIEPDSLSDLELVIFMFKRENNDETLGLLELDSIDYEVRYIKQQAVSGNIPASRLQRFIKSILRQSRDLWERAFGTNIFGEVKYLDYFIQPDQAGILPKGKLKKVLILYDIIPYVLEWDYLWNYKTARLKNLPVLSSVRCSARRWLYLKKQKINTRKADILLAISEATKNDFVKYVNIRESKIKVIHLGVSNKKKVSDDTGLYRYVTTPWGYMKRPFKMDLSEPFILYVGGADPRRRLDDLVAAYNALRAEGHKLYLILTGDTMQGPDAIPTPSINKALKSSSYLDEIVFMGFVPDDIREMLYHEALAFVYPSKYEGFGLPVLEAMNRGTPVITYNNSSIPEVGGKAVLYADGYLQIADYIKEFLVDEYKKQKYKTAGLAQAKKFNWSKTSSEILKSLT